MADTEQEGAPSATAGGAPAPILDLSAFEKAGRLLAAAWLEQQAARAAYWRGLFGGLSANREPHAMQEVDRSTCPNCWGDLPPDPRDAEIKQLRTALARYQKRLGDDLLSGGKLVERVRAALRINDGGTCTRASMDGVIGDVGRLCEETERLRGEVYSNNVAMGGFVTRIATALGGKSFGDARELVDDVQQVMAERDRKRRELADVTAEVTRLKRLVGNEDVSYDGWDQYSRHDAIVRCEEGWQEYLKVRDERDRLRQELDLVHEKHATGLVTLRTDFTAAVNGLLPKPAEPRRWVVGDPEPEIGTTVWRRAERYRRSSNGWHRVGDLTGYGSWAWILSVGSEIVEAVDRG